MAWCGFGSSCGGLPPCVFTFALKVWYTHPYDETDDDDDDGDDDDHHHHHH